MKIKLVVRLLTAAGELLAWAPLRAVARGDRCIRAAEVCVLAPLEDGAAAEIVLHWPDLHIQKRERFPTPLLVRKGMPLMFQWDVLWTLPSDDGVLPPVTVGSTAVSVPTGAMGAIAQ